MFVPMYSDFYWTVYRKGISRYLGTCDHKVPLNSSILKIFCGLLDFSHQSLYPFLWHDAKLYQLAREIFHRGLFQHFKRYKCISYSVTIKHGVKYLLSNLHITFLQTFQFIFLNEMQVPSNALKSKFVLGSCHALHWAADTNLSW